MTPVAAAYNRTQFPVIADIGGIGAELASVLDVSPVSKGILFDKSHLSAVKKIRNKIDLLQSYAWPGNIRRIAECDRARIVCEADRI